MYTGFKDYYEVLKVPFSATEADIKNAYRQLAKEYHPDLHPDDTEHFTDKFREITEAYETLSDALKKENYDFLYRRVVLQEFPREEYYPAYYEDPTPPDTKVYTHKYTNSRKLRSLNITGILVGILLVLQLGALIIKAAPVHTTETSRSKNAGFPTDMFRERKADKTEQAPKKDSSILFINRPGVLE